MAADQPIILLGAGLAGSLMSVYLAQKGFKVDVYERRPDMRNVEISAGRSINLALSERGLTALRAVGLEEEIRELCIPMPGRMIHSQAGDLTFQPYSKDERNAINSVSRGELNMRLMSTAEAHPDVNFHFRQRCLDFNHRTGEVLMKDEESGREFTLKGQTVIGADGAFSGLRQGMMKSPRFNYSQSFLTHGYKELAIPPAEGGGYRIDKNALHIWPRGTYMLIALPNLDGSFTVTLFFPYDGEPYSFNQLDTDEKIMAFFKDQFPDAVDVMPNLLQDYHENPTADLVTVRCSPWSYEGTAALIGDACHAIVPFFGQGMNAAFEDCRVLSECIDRHDGNWKQIFSDYQDQRIDNANAIADMAIENYIEMRDKTGDPGWRFRKQVEHELERVFPGQYVSRYEMVSFTNVPYRDAYRRGELNEQLLMKLTEGISTLEEVDMTLAGEMVSQLGA